MATWRLAENRFGKYWIPECCFNSYTAQTTIAGRIHEYETIDYIRRNAGNGAIVHAGTGFGDFLPALKDLPNNVYAFEPNPDMYSATLKTLKENSIANVTLFKEGLSGREDSHERFCLDGIRTEVSQYGNDILHTTTMDSMIPEGVSLIHLDIEGHEFEALDGARLIIESYSPTIILEIDGRAVDYNNYMQYKYDYEPVEQLIHNSGPMVFVNTVYKKRTQ